MRLCVFVMEGVVSVGGWFRENISKKMGDGMNTLFWTDSWVGGVPLAIRFRRLYD